MFSAFRIRLEWKQRGTSLVKHRTYNESETILKNLEHFRDEAYFAQRSVLFLESIISSACEVNNATAVEMV